MPAALAVIPALGYVALMPVYRGEFATFNIPYPSWYVALTALTSTLALLRFFADGRLRWVLVAGVLAGIGCAFKPNSGVFNLAALAVTLLLAGSPDGSLWQRLVW